MPEVLEQLFCLRISLLNFIIFLNLKLIQTFTIEVLILSVSMVHILRCHSNVVFYLIHR